MKTRPILFSAPMIRAILDGTKTQTRRIIKPEHLGTSMPVDTVLSDLSLRTFEEVASLCPHGHIGDQLWVRETHKPFVVTGKKTGITYAAGGEKEIPATHAGWAAMFNKASRNWRPSIFMPRWASRIDLAILDVGAERVQDITEADAIAEGCDSAAGALGSDYITVGLLAERLGCKDSWARARYAVLWDRINPDSWQTNPWVWVITFRRVTP